MRSGSFVLLWVEQCQPALITCFDHLITYLQRQAGMKVPHLGFRHFHPCRWHAAMVEGVEFMSSSRKTRAWPAVVPPRRDMASSKRASSL